MMLLAIPALMVGAVALDSCTKVEATIKDTATCAETAAVKDIEPTIQAILTTAGDIWQKLLGALETSLGADLVDCAVTAVKADLIAKQSASPAAATAVQRADAWLNRHKRTSLEPDVPLGEPAVACVAGWVPEGERNGHPVCPQTMSREASAR